MRAVLSALLDVAGIVALTVGGWWLAPWVGMVVLGLGCIIVAWAIDPPRRSSFEIPDEETEEAEESEQPEQPPAPVAGLDWGPPQP